MLLGGRSTLHLLPPGVPIAEVLTLSAAAKGSSVIFLLAWGNLKRPREHREDRERRGWC